MDLAKIPSTLQLGNVVLGAVDAFDLRRAYHGYARNKTITGALKWAAAPFFLGYVGGGIALAIAAKQGYGKKLPAPVQGTKS